MRTSEILAIAKKHSITKDLAAPDFFEGALLGNGDLGVVACTRPDAIVLHLGHNDIWDIRIEGVPLRKSGAGSRRHRGMSMRKNGTGSMKRRLLPPT